MIKEAIDRVAELTRGEDKSLTTAIQLVYQGTVIPYTYKTTVNPSGVRTLGDMLKPPRPDKIAVSTLTGFLDAVKAGVAGDITKRMVHVEDHLTVSLVSTTSDEFGVRDTFITAKHKPLDAFHFDQHYADPSKFIIGLQVAFLTTDPLLELIRMVSYLRAGNSIQTNDDGYSQTVTLKRGEIESADVKVPPRVKLIPIRSFSEIAHVQSEFLLRFNQGPAGNPQPALWNVDGTKWIDETMLAIKHYLEKQAPLKGVPIIA